MEGENLENVGKNSFSILIFSFIFLKNSKYFVRALILIKIKMLQN